MSGKDIAYYLSEFIGTFVMMFVGISAITLNLGTVTMKEIIPDYSIRLLLTAVLFAGGATLVVYSPVGRISGAHFNPAVTLAFFLEKKIGIVNLVIYSLMQVLGSICAALLALLAWTDNAQRVNVGMTLPGEGRHIVFVYFIEVIISLLFISLIFFFLQRRHLTRYAGIAVGFLVVIIVFLTVPVSGTGLNPARSLGPAIASRNFSYIWIYTTAPFLGSVIAVLLHKNIPFLRSPLCAKLNHKEKDKQCLYNCRLMNRPN